jgi:hypothetical protein
VKIWSSLCFGPVRKHWNTFFSKDWQSHFWPRIGISNQYDTQIITSKPSQFTWHSQYLGVWLLGRGLSLDRCYILLVFLYVSGKFVNGSFS